MDFFSSIQQPPPQPASDSVDQNLRRAMLEEYYKKLVGESFAEQGSRRKREEEAEKQERDFRDKTLLERQKEAAAKEAAGLIAKEQAKKDILEYDPELIGERKEAQIPGLLRSREELLSTAQPLIRGLQVAKQLFKAMPKDQQFLSKLEEDRKLTSEEAGRFLALKAIVDERMSELKEYTKTNQNLFYDPKGKPLPLGETMMQQVNAENKFLKNMDKVLASVRGKHPTIKYGDFINTLDSGFSLFHLASQNPVIQSHPEGKEVLGKNKTPEEFQNTYNTIDKYIKAHASWVKVPEIDMFVPEEKYKKLKTMSGYMISSKGLEIFPGSSSQEGFPGKGSSEWEFLSSLPAGSKEEFLKALQASGAVKDPTSHVAAALQNMVVQYRYDPEELGKLIQVLPFWAGRNGMPIQKIVNEANKYLNYNLHANRDETPLKQVTAEKNKLLAPLAAPRQTPPSLFGPAEKSPLGKFYRPIKNVAKAAAAPWGMLWRETPKMFSDLYEKLVTDPENLKKPLYGPRTQKGVNTGEISER